MTDQGAGAAVAAEPLVSVVIAVYNGQDLVGQAISSVLRQTHSNIEVFVVDDGSTDHTPEVLAGYEAVDRPGRRVRVLRQENAGCGAARNRALEQVRGEFVTDVDADDCCPTTWRRCCAATGSCGCVLVGRAPWSTPTRGSAHPPGSTRSVWCTARPCRRRTSSAA